MKVGMKYSHLKAVGHDGRDAPRRLVDGVLDIHATANCGGCGQLETACRYRIGSAGYAVRMEPRFFGSQFCRPGISEGVLSFTLRVRVCNYRLPPWKV